jgi:hypothetical protein
VQSYVRRGELEAVVEGEGVEKTFYVSIDSLNALRERRRISGEGASRFVTSAPGVSAGSDFAASTTQSGGEVAPDLIEVVQDLQYRLGRAEAQVELTARTESTLREQLAREQERADRLEAELRETHRPPSETREGSLPPSNKPGRGDLPSEQQEAVEHRSWWRRFFGY